MRVALQRNAPTLAMRTVDTRSPQAVLLLSNNSNYHQPFEGGNCLCDIIEAVQNAMCFYCSLQHNYHWPVCNVYNQLTPRLRENTPSRPMLNI